MRAYLELKYTNISCCLKKQNLIDTIFLCSKSKNNN